jgi:hypothetical protein
LPIARKLKLTVYAAAIFALNFFVCHELFFTEYTDRVTSGDSNFISISRYMLDHWRDASWWPVWYNGIPGHDSYPPLLHALVALLAAIERISPALAHHQFACIVYALAPIGMFFLVERVSRSAATAFAAAAIFSLLSPSTLLLSSARIGSGGWLGPWRLCVLTVYGDAPHMFGFALIPFAILALDTALKRRRPVNYLITALIMAAILLTNWLGSMALACSVIAWLIATTETSGVITTALIALSAYLLASPWIPPSTLRIIASGGQVDEGDFHADMSRFPLRAFLLAIILALVKYALQKRKAPAAIQLPIFLLFLPGCVPIIFDWTRIALLPTPHRYVWETDFALCMLIAAISAAVLQKAPRQITWAVIAAALVLGGRNLYEYRKYAIAVIHPIDMKTTVEYKTTDWLKRNHPDARIFAIGTVAYWMNTFSDIQQVSGGFDPGTPNPIDRTALKTISETTSPETTLLWLRAFGADFAAVGGPHTSAPFRIFTAPARFDKIAQKVWSDGDDFIYQIPRRSRSLAQIVRRGDTANIERYVAALEDPSLPTASFQWQTAHTAVITAQIPSEDILSVQITYSPGWHVKVNGARRRIQKDALGLMTIVPDCTGPCTILLNYDGGLEDRVTQIAAIATLLTLLGLCLVARCQGTTPA